ncbi:hypothetical protein THAOC_29303 [Thalassiosira oceanica]|uniref:MYND-type domain-containing protein n=1 Tax=Thalassiosira oceanica TaxID=159749 RepID=K0RCT1_THAOC|nr:hypothetical protein THAOC_29303 [Thalassiosira oceanica]|eukprot:EJK51518.1 hypothetical protein THAOC_29303 [Thalassiosira oceanica]
MLVELLNVVELPILAEIFLSFAPARHPLLPLGLEGTSLGPRHDAPPQVGWLGWRQKVVPFFRLVPVRSEKGARLPSLLSLEEGPVGCRLVARSSEGYNEVSDRFQLRHHEGLGTPSTPSPHPSRRRVVGVRPSAPVRQQGNDCPPADRRQSRRSQSAPRFRRRRDGDGDPALSIHWSRLRSLRAITTSAPPITISHARGTQPRLLLAGHKVVPSTSFYTMSCVPVVVDGDEVCANCGKQGSDTVKLKNCTACRLVKYCGVDCQRAHRKQHKKACKRRAAELKDEQLYSQGHERMEGDFCPICTLPIALPVGRNSTNNVCCMKRICDGCHYAAQLRGMFDCTFCRTPMPDNDADMLAKLRARVEKEVPEAIHLLGLQYFYGGLGIQKDMRRAVELWTEAAELGSVEALFNLGIEYESGKLVQQDKAKAAEFYTKAAVQGHVESRYNLGVLERNRRNYDRAVKHWLISAKMGDKESLENIEEAFMVGGLATKEHYAEALKGYQAAVEEMKSHDRDEAKRLGF